MALVSLSANAAVKPIVLTTPDDYQLIALSPNGKWATGIYVDNSSNTFAFLWNLESGNIRLLSNTETSYGSAVSNDGVVAGHYTFHPADGSSSYETPGWYKDGEWHACEQPNGMRVGDLGSAGQGGGITPDGRLMSGAMYINGVYTPMVWNLEEGGKIVAELDITNPEGGSRSGNAYCISPDGLYAGGWSYCDNRTATMWTISTNEKKYIGLTDHNHQTPWASVDKFSPDGKKVLYGGGWNYNVDEESNTQYGYRLCDLETGQLTQIPTMGGESTVQLFGISNDYTVVGSTGDYDAGRAIIYHTAGSVWDESEQVFSAPRGEFLEDYLKAQGVDFSKYNVFPNPENPSRLTLFRGQDITADGNGIAILYYGISGQYAAMRSMVVLLNQDADHAAPVELGLKQMEAISCVKVTWAKPVRAADGIKGFAIYRDGEKIAEVPANATSYYDNAATYGNHTYYVTSVYADEETPSAQHTITVIEKPVQAPQALYARQKGFSSVQAQWLEPQSNLVNKSWYNPATANLQGFGIGLDDASIEMGIGFDREEMELYKGSKIVKVNFYPMSKQENLTLNIYKYNAKNLPELIYTQPVTEDLNWRQRNTITLNQPVDLPTDGDIVVAFSCHLPEASNEVLGMDYGHYNPRYSDLLRFTDENDFYSYYDLRAEQGYPDYMTFMIDMVLAPEGSDSSVDAVKEYEVLLNGVSKGTTNDLKYVIPHATVKTTNENVTVGVKAIYANGTVSPVTESVITLKGSFPALTAYETEAASASSVKVSWEAPVDYDSHDITYAGSTPGTSRLNGIVGPAENNYGFMAAAKYSPNVLKGYNGYQINSLKFYPTADAVFTFMLIEDGKQIAEAEVYEYELNKWNEVQLPETIEIKETSTYYLVLDIYDAEPEMSPIALDSKAPFVGTSDLYTAGDDVLGATWSSISADTGMRGNWMMGINVIDPDQVEAPIESYDVYISKPGTTTTPALVASKITDTEYVHDFGENVSGRGRVRVNIHYAGRSAVAAGPILYYEFTYDGIDAINAADAAAKRKLYTLNGIIANERTRGIVIGKNRKYNIK